MKEIYLNSIEELIVEGRELYKKGYTEIYNYNSPTELSYGYVFVRERRKDEEIYLKINSSSLLNYPDSYYQAFSSEMWRNKRRNKRWKWWNKSSAINRRLNEKEKNKDWRNERKNKRSY